MSRKSCLNLELPGLVLVSSWAILDQLRATWSYLGAILGSCWAMWGLSWALLLPAWGQLGLVWGDLGPVWISLGRLEAILKPFWKHPEGILMQFWNEVGPPSGSFLIG